MTTVAAKSPGRRQPGLRRAALLLGASLVAALASWLIGETGVTTVAPRSVLVQRMGGPVMEPTYETRTVADRATAVLTFGLFGGLFGLSFGLAGGLVGCRSRTWWAGGLGLLLGGAVGAGLPLGIMPLYESLHLHDDSLLPSLLMHLGCWAPLGAVAGLAFGLGLGGWRPALTGLVAGLLGAGLGAACFEILGAIRFATAATGDAISATAVTRLLARLGVALLTAVCLVLTVKTDRTPQPVVAEPPVEPVA